MSDTEENTQNRLASITLFNDPDRNEVSTAKTLVIFGVNRGGTSMVAGVARAFGFFMGGDLAVNNEDTDFAYRSIDEMRSTIDNRNGAYGDWGWKFPMAGEYIVDLISSLRNPILIIVTRDIVATSLGLVRWDDRSAITALLETSRQNQKNLDAVIHCERPAMFVSYEKAISLPEAFIDEMANFLGRKLAVTLSSITEYMRAGSYKAYEDYID